MCRRRAPYSKAPDLTMAAQAAPSSGKHNASRRFGKGAGLLFLFLAPGGVFRGLISALPGFPHDLSPDSSPDFGLRFLPLVRPWSVPVRSRFNHPLPRPPRRFSSGNRPPLSSALLPVASVPRRICVPASPAPPASSPRLFPPPPPSTLPQPLPLPPPFRSFRRPCASLPVELRGSSSAPSGSRFRFQGSFR